MAPKSTKTTAADLDATFAAADDDLDASVAGDIGSDTDAGFVVDLASVVEPDRSPIPAGNYEMVIKSVKAGMSKGKAATATKPAVAPAPMLTVALQPVRSIDTGETTHSVTRKDDDGNEFTEDVPLESKTVFDYWVFSKDAMYFTKPKLTAAGVDPKYKGAVRPDMLQGARLQVTVSVQPSSGTREDGTPYGPRNQADAYLPLGSAMSIDSVLG